MNSEILSIDNETFSKFSQLERLHMSSCQLQQAPPIHDVCSTLTSLVLSQNRIKSLPLDYFDGCLKLENVNLRKNDLEMIPNMLPLATTLQSLSLEYNALTDCMGLCEIRFSALREADLSGNQLQSFPLDQVIGLWGEIVYIALAENNLTTLKKPNHSNPEDEPTTW